ncbi:MAG: hypothetical protein HOW73_23800, partial [Polyangiaceae bacterium]|nr:hypothetical protein [Polyangiaceae bacterium]
RGVSGYDAGGWSCLALGIGGIAGGSPMIAIGRRNRIAREATDLWTVPVVDVGTELSLRWSF